MRKKICKLVVCLMLTSTVLTACKNPLDMLKKNKEEETSASDIISSYEDDIVLSEQNEFSIGDTVTIDDIVSIYGTTYNDVVSKRLVDELGNDIDMLDTSSAGSYAVNVIIELVDGSTWSRSYSYVVTGSEQGSIALGNAVNHYTYYGGSTPITMLIDSYDDRISYYKYTGDTEYRSYDPVDNENDANYISASLSTGREYAVLTGDRFFFSDVKQDIINTYKTVVTFTEMTDEQESKFFDYLEQLMDIISYGVDSTGEIDYLNTVSGSTSDIPIKYVSVQFDKSYIGDIEPESISYLDTDSVISLPICYVIGDDYNIIPDWYDDSTITAETLITTLVNENLDMDSYETFEDWLASLKDSVDWSQYSIGFNKESDVRFIKEHFLAGEITDEPINNVEIPMEDVEEETTEQVIINVKPTYQSQHPELYVWPESDTKYRRWVHTTDEDTEFIGAIINPDGTSRTSDGTYNPSDVSGSTSSSLDFTVDESYTLIPAVGTSNIKVSLASRSKITINKDRTTQFGISLSYGNNEYVIKVYDEDTLNSSLTKCLYTIPDMALGKFDVSLKSSTGSGEGTIADYVINYNDVNGRSKSGGYLVDYTLNNNHICIYGSNLDDDTSTMKSIISELNISME